MLLQKIKARLVRLFSRSKLGHNPWQERQNAFMQKCLLDRGVKIKGVIHVGGHLGEEYPIYRQAGAKVVAFFEPMPHVFDELQKKFGGQDDVLLFCKAVGAVNETREIYVNRGSGESSSFLKPTNLHDGYFELDRVALEVVSLDSFLPTVKDAREFNLLVTDTQGFDMEVLKGARSALAKIEYIYTEVSKGHYHNEPALEDFDYYLGSLGFKRAAIEMYGSWKGADSWGDVFYVRVQPARA